jgi:hypothetical protein
VKGARRGRTGTSRMVRKSVALKCVDKRLLILRICQRNSDQSISDDYLKKSASLSKSLFRFLQAPNPSKSSPCKFTKNPLLEVLEDPCLSWRMHG